MSFIIPGRHGIGTTEHTRIDGEGFEKVARKYLDLHYRDNVPEDQLGSDFQRVLDMFGCRSIEELKVNRRY